MAGNGNIYRIIPDSGSVRHHKWYWPWLAAGSLNFIFIWIIASVAEVTIVFGDLAPVGAIPVTVITERQLAAPIEEVEPPAPEIITPEIVDAVMAPPDPLPEPVQKPPVPEPEPEYIPPRPEPEPILPEPVFEATAPELGDTTPQPEPVPAAPEALPEPEAELVLPEPEPERVIPPILETTDPDEIDYEGLTGPEIDALYRARTALPEISLPEAGGGGDSGVVAIFCPEEFDDPDKAAECAGRTEIRSGWTGEGEDWSSIVNALQRGGLSVPDAPGGGQGPSWQSPLADNESYYEPADQRYVLGPDGALAAASARGYQALRETSWGTEGTTNQVGQSLDNLGAEATCYNRQGCDYEPSWTLSEDPYISNEDLDRIIIDD